MKMPLVHVVIPNKNGMSHLAYSLPSLFSTDYPSFKVVLVDDRSSDKSVEYVENNFPVVEVLLNSGKRGFAASVNMGIRAALAGGAEMVVVANSDIKVPSWWLKAASNLFNERANVGVIGFKEVLRTTTNTQDFTGFSHSIESRDAKYIAGCLFAVRASVFKKVGLFDEDYFMYGEDDDLFSRVRKAGFEMLGTNIPVWHYGEGSSSGNHLFPTWMAYRNALRCSAKNNDVLGVFKTVAILFYNGCIPHISWDISNPSLNRLRRYNPLVNMVLLIGSIAWNVWNLPLTIRARRRESGMSH